MRRAVFVFLLIGAGCDGRIGAELAEDEQEVEAPAPRIRIDEPEAGAFIDGGPDGAILVRGRILEGDVQEVTINGAPATLSPDGVFRFLDPNPAPGVHHYRARAEDPRGRVASVGRSILYGRFAPEGTPVKDALQVHIGRAPLGALAASLRARIEAEDFEALVMEDNPIAEDWWGTLTVSSLVHGSVEATLIPDHEGLAVTVEVSGLTIALHNDAPGPWNQDAVVQIDRTVLAGTVVMSPAPDGWIDADLVDPVVRLEGFDFDLEGLIGEPLIEGSVEDMVHDRLEDLVEGTVPELLHELLGEGPSGVVEVGGAVLDFDLEVSDVDVSDVGLELRADASMQARQRSPLVPESPGALRVGAPYPIEVENRVQAGLADDFTNQALSALWSSGVLDTEVALSRRDGPMTVRTVSVVFPGLEDLAPLDAPVIATLDPLLPPVVRSGDGGAELAIGELRLTLEAEVGTKRVHLATLALEIQGEVAIGQADPGIAISPVNPRFHADPVDVPPGFPQGDVLDGLLAGAYDLLHLDLLSIPLTLPLPGLQLVDCDLDGSRPNTLVIGCDGAQQ